MGMVSHPKKARLPAELLRPFRALAFDWDGTAVESRKVDAGAVTGPIERLLESGVIVFVVTGTNFENMNRQLSSFIRGPHKENLLVSTNRGSEVWGFDGESNPVRRWRREATPVEDEALTEIADGVRARLIERTGLDVGVIYDRLNRRKVDLIPTEEWADPPKSSMRELECAVDLRLEKAGLLGGLREAIEIAREVQRRSPVPLRITSDRKHIEIGLTDKSDAVSWLANEVLGPRGIRAEEVLVLGDELGPVGGLPGSDDSMRIPALAGAVFVSVGPEPSGVPEGVIHLGGGPACFRRVLEAQAALHPLDLPANRIKDDSWLLVDEGFNIAREHEIESIFAIGNGYLGSRASLAEGSRQSFPATFAAGVYQRTGPSLPELWPMWEWANLRVRASGDPFSLYPGRYVLHHRILDLRQGILWRDWHHVDQEARLTRFRALRLASMADRHLLVQSVLFSADNYSGDLHLETVFPKVPLRMESSGSARVLVFELPVQGSDVKVAFAMLTRVVAQTGAHVPLGVDVAGAHGVAHAVVSVEPGQSYCLDRVVAVFTSLETSDPAEAARREIDRVVLQGLPATVEAHVEEWEHRWKSADLRIDGDLSAQRWVRFAVYHLTSAARADNVRSSVGARALTGAIYSGHVFWDTEIYMLPFYTHTAPAVARSLLMYRHHTLPAARARALERGYRGALYAWESADTGEDVTPPFVLAPTGHVLRVVAGEQEHHISADVAYGVWSYWSATQDDSFLRAAGAEILFETARFWASRVTVGSDGLFHILHVQGPDEYHESVDDNAYTNCMAQWNLERALETARLLREQWPESFRDLKARLALEDSEVLTWKTIAGRMYTGLNPETGLIEQFRGYFALHEVAMGGLEPRTAALDLILGHERLQRSKAIKQPDVVLLVYLLWDRFSPQVREANYRYYEPRTAHGSSLSPSIYALVAARLGKMEQAWLYFEQAAQIDLADNLGNASGGVHAGALGGLWQAVVFGFAGVELRPEGPVPAPHLPPRWRALRFALLWRGRRFALQVGAAGESVQAPPVLEAAS